MAEITKHLKSALWTEFEVGAVVAGAVVSTMAIDEKKIFKNEFAINPAWFEGPRTNAPFKIRWFPAMKAGGALLASTYVNNPWIKLILFGVAVQGTIQQLRIITWDNKKMDYAIPSIGANDQAGLDAELKRLAMNYRKVNGPSYEDGQNYTSGMEEDMDGPEEDMDGPEQDLGDRYESNVAGPDRDLGDRYESNVAGPFDEDNDMGFSFDASDETQAA